MSQADFAGLAGGGDAERAGVRVLLRDASKDGFEHLRVEVVFGDRAPRLGVALQRVQPRLHRLDVEAGEIRHCFAEGSQPLGGEEMKTERGGVHRQAQRVERVLQRPQRQGAALLRFQAGLERDDAARLVPEGHLAALLVLDQVRGEDVALGSPRPKQHHQLAEARIARLGPQLPQREQPRVAARFDDEVRLAGAAGHGERTSQAAGADRLLDVVELRVGRAPRVVLVGLDLVDRELDLRFRSRVDLAGEIAGVVTRVSDAQRLGDQSPPLVDRHLAAHADRSSAAESPA